MSQDEHTLDNIKSALKAFLLESIMPVAKVNSFEDDDSFMEKGILDSTGVLELVGFIEDKWAIRVESEELVPENLDSLSKLTLFIERKTAPPSFQMGDSPSILVQEEGTS